MCVSLLAHVFHIFGCVCKIFPTGRDGGSPYWDDGGESPLPPPGKNLLVSPGKIPK